LAWTSQITEAAAQLSDEELVREILVAKRCALCALRTRRDLAWQHVHCLCVELERRGLDPQDVLRRSGHGQPVRADSRADHPTPMPAARRT
jgi:hypothetical protein